VVVGDGVVVVDEGEGRRRGGGSWSRVCWAR
jgi:hypothetical protein